MANFTHDDIYSFLNGDMDAEASLAFEQQLQSDQELAQEVALHKDLFMGISLAGDQALMQEIQEAGERTKKKDSLNHDDQVDSDLLAGIMIAGDQTLKNEIAQTQQKLAEKGFFDKKEESTPIRKLGRTRSIFTPQNMAIAASLLLLFVIGFFLLKPDTVYQDTYASNFVIDKAFLDDQVDELSAVGMAITDKDRRVSLKAALELFQKGNFHETQLALEAHLQQFPDDEAARFYLGLSLMEIEDYESGASTLELLAKKSSSDFSTKSQWYMALCFLMIDDKRDLAKTEFEQIAKDATSPYKSRAEKILRSLKNQ